MKRVSNPDDRQRMIEAFRALAPELRFQLTPSSFEIGDHTDIGFLLVVFAANVADFEVGSPKPLDSDDDEQIRAVIQGWEKLLPEQYAIDFQDFANDPYLLLMGEGIGIVSSDKYPGLEHFDLESRDHPHYEPRRVTLDHFQIVHLGGFRAVATYTFSEEFQDGSTLYANAFVALARLKDGWRIVIASDHHLKGSEGASP